MIDLTICIPTFGNSQLRLYHLLKRIRELSGISGYQIIVSDDGTPNPIINKYKQLICEEFGAKYTTCPSPNGICQNINHLFNNVETEYLFLLEDGNLPTKDFLKPAIKLMEKWDSLVIDGKKPGLLGWSFIEFWELLTIMGTDLDISDTMNNLNFQEARDYFYKNVPEKIDRIELETKSNHNLLCSLYYKKYDQESSYLKRYKSYLSSSGRWGTELPFVQKPFWENILWPVRWTWSTFLTKKSIIEKIHSYALPFEGWLGGKMWKSNRYCAFVPSPPVIHLKNQCFQDLDKYYPECRKKIVPRDYVNYIFKKEFGVKVDDLCLLLEDKYLNSDFLLKAKELGEQYEL